MTEFAKLTEDDYNSITKGLIYFRESYCKNENLPINMQNINITADYIKDGIDRKLFGQGENLDIWIQLLGFHFGDLLIDEFSGEWMIEKNFDELCVVINDGISCYPLNMVRKYFKYGDEHNLHIKYMFLKDRLLVV